MHKILFVGSKSTGFTCFESLLKVRSKEVFLGTIDDRPDSRSLYDSFYSKAEEYGIPVKELEGNADLAELVRDVRPDIVFICGWYWVISETLLQQVPRGVFGIHNSLLPKYRGHAPLVWSLLNGDQVIGASLFQFDRGMDTGNVFHQWQIDNSGQYIAEIIKLLDSAIGSDFGQVFLQVLESSVQPSQQDHNQATYCAKRRPEDGLVDWTQSAIQVLRCIRVLSEPYPDSFTFIGRKRVLIRKAELFTFPVQGFPGQVVCILDGGAVLCCGDGRGLLVTEAIDETGERDLSKLFQRLSSPEKLHEFLV